MQFKKFWIKNFKGIKNVEIDLSKPGAGIFTLIGLNESGKTTILDALALLGKNLRSEDLSALSPSPNQVEDSKRNDYRYYIHNDKIWNFTDTIEVKSELSFAEGEKQKFVKNIKKEFNISLCGDSILDVMDFSLVISFENEEKGQAKIFTAALHRIRARKSPRHRKWEKLDKGSANKIYHYLRRHHFPKIVHFPSFLFYFPKEIILNLENTDTDIESSTIGETQNRLINQHYKTVLLNLAKRHPEPFDLETSIVTRAVQNSENEQEDRSISTRSLKTTLNKISSVLTNTIIEQWKEAFPQHSGAGEIQVTCAHRVHTRKYRTEEDAEMEYEAVGLEIQTKHGDAYYPITQKSLGFRWFFSFSLFTTYGPGSESSNPALYLLDEPAANLHSSTQVKILSKLEKIAAEQNTRVIYTTHSPYLIEPRWINQAFIVANKAIEYNEDSQEIIDSSSAPTTDIVVEKYGSFVGRSDNKTTHYQPVLDKLGHAPSKLEIQSRTVFVEGISDYYLLEYGRTVLLGPASKKGKKEFVIIPCSGASGMDPHISRAVGFRYQFVILLDDDKEGKEAKAKYLKEWSLYPEEKVFTLVDIEEKLKGKAIESILDENDQKIIDPSGEGPSKNLISSFFAEKLAKKEKVALSDDYRNFIQKFVEEIEKRLDATTDESP